MLKLSTTTVSQVLLRDLIPDPDQPRQSFDDKALEALADNIKERGIQVPLLVRVRSNGKKNETVIKDGERRWRAAKLAKLKTVPVLLVKASDAAQIRIDQVSVNNLRERLTPMELAKTLQKMQMADKLTLNEIAARLDKQGIPMSQAEVVNLVKLVKLPAWAQGMVNAGEIEITAAREIAGITDKPVLAKLEKGMRRSLNYRGRLTVREVQNDIQDAYRDCGKDLQRTNEYLHDPVRFDYKKVCKGCTHLREFAGGAYCLDAAGFKKHQAEAAEAGLLAGGKLPAKERAKSEKPPTPAQQKKLETAKAKKRTASLETKSKEYLHAWAIARVAQYLQERHAEWIQGKLPPDDRQTALRLVEFAAACRPGIPSWEGFGSASWRDRPEDKLRKAAVGAGYPSLNHFLSAPRNNLALQTAIANQIVQQLPLIETLHLAHNLFGDDLALLWKIDAAYLDLLQKAELLQVAEKHAVLPDGKRAWGGLKVQEITAAILAVADKVGVPPSLAAIYSQPAARDPDDDSENDFSDESDDE